MIEVKGLRKNYRIGFALKSVEVLHGINLTVQKGEICGFVGSNGAGKSTTIKSLLGLLRPGSGSIRVLGEEPGNKAVRKHLGYLPEHPYFYDYLSGRELLRFYGKLLGLKKGFLERRIGECLEKVHGNHPWIDQPLKTYSKGMVQRVGLAQAILGNPELLILDEPMSGLDPVGRKDVRDTILSLNESGTTIFYSSHVLSDVEAISHRVHMIDRGLIVKSGTLSEILSKNGEITIEFAESEKLRELSENLPKGISRQGHFFLAKDESSSFELLKLAASKDLYPKRVAESQNSLEDVLTDIISDGGHAK